MHEIEVPFARARYLGPLPMMVEKRDQGNLVLLGDLQFVPSLGAIVVNFSEMFDREAS